MNLYVSWTWVQMSDIDTYRNVGFGYS